MDLREAYRLEQELLTTQLAVVRATVPHQGEKGRALEAFVEKLLREALPQEYGITTGFIAFPPDVRGGPVTMSGQLDIIIYDALHGSPLIRLPTADILPLEAALACVEVKASIDPSGLRVCASQAANVRRHTTRWFWSNQGRNQAQPVGISAVSTRAYVFAFEGSGSLDSFQAALTAARDEDGEHAAFSGVFINGCGLLQSAPPCEPLRSTDALAEFRHAILHGLARYPRYAPREHRGPRAMMSSDADYFHMMKQGGTSAPSGFVDVHGQQHLLTDILDLTAPYLAHYTQLADRHDDEG